MCLSKRTTWTGLLAKDFAKLRDELIEKSNDKIEKIKANHGGNSVEAVEGSIQNINYPVLEYPTKIKSFNLDKDPVIDAKLMGIKGQYLIFDTGVINIRKFSGYKCNISG